LTLREGYNTYLRNLKDKDIITNHEYIRLINIINNDEAWKFLRTQDRDVNTLMNLKNRRVTLFERILGVYNEKIEVNRLRIKALRLFQNVLNINQATNIKDFEVLIGEIESTLLKNDINIGQKDVLKAFKRNLARSKLIKESLKSEYIRISTKEVFDNRSDNATSHYLETGGGKFKMLNKKTFETIASNNSLTNFDISNRINTTEK
jgi:hypothetical protein